MNCESKICVLENVQTVNSVYVISVFFLLVVIFGWITSRFKSPLKFNMYTVCIK